MTKTAKGALACARLDQRALEKGAVTSIPIADVRYGRVVDWNGRLYRVQVDLRSVGHRGVSSNGCTSAEVDAVVVYIPRVYALCWFDIATCRHCRRLLFAWLHPGTAR